MNPWPWCLSETLPEQRANYEITGDGQAIHWPEIDENLSADGMLYGAPKVTTQTECVTPEEASVLLPRL